MLHGHQRTTAAMSQATRCSFEYRWCQMWLGWLQAAVLERTSPSARFGIVRWGLPKSKKLCLSSWKAVCRFSGTVFASVACDSQLLGFIIVVATVTWNMERGLDIGPVPSTTPDLFRSLQVEVTLIVRLFSTSPTQKRSFAPAAFRHSLHSDSSLDHVLFNAAFAQVDERTPVSLSARSTSRTRRREKARSPQNPSVHQCFLGVYLSFDAGRQEIGFLESATDTGLEVPDRRGRAELWGVERHRHLRDARQRWILVHCFALGSRRGSVAISSGCLWQSVSAMSAMLRLAC